MSYETLEIIEAGLKEPFYLNEYEWRPSRVGWHKEKGPWALVLCYVTNRAIMDRLDKVVSPFRWQNSFIPINGGFACKISIKDPETNEWIDKWDGSDTTEIEALKGGLSGAMKRAAVQWGIGRHLYKLTETFAVCKPDRPTNMESWTAAKVTVDGQDRWFYWKPPMMAEWAYKKVD